MFKKAIILLSLSLSLVCAAKKVEWSAPRPYYSVVEHLADLPQNAGLFYCTKLLAAGADPKYVPFEISDYWQKDFKGPKGRYLRTSRTTWSHKSENLFVTTIETRFLTHKKGIDYNNRKSWIKYLNHKRGGTGRLAGIIRELEDATRWGGVRQRQRRSWGNSDAFEEKRMLDTLRYMGYSHNLEVWSMDNGKKRRLGGLRIIFSYPLLKGDSLPAFDFLGEFGPRSAFMNVEVTNLYCDPRPEVMGILIAYLELAIGMRIHESSDFLMAQVADMSRLMREWRLARLSYEYQLPHRFYHLVNLVTYGDELSSEYYRGYGFKEVGPPISQLGLNWSPMVARLDDVEEAVVKALSRGYDENNAERRLWRFYEAGGGIPLSVPSRDQVLGFRGWKRKTIKSAIKTLKKIRKNREAMFPIYEDLLE